jgi:hypothetical protein
MMPSDHRKRASRVGWSRNGLSGESLLRLLTSHPNRFFSFLLSPLLDPLTGAHPRSNKTAVRRARFLCFAQKEKQWFILRNLSPSAVKS